MLFHVNKAAFSYSHGIFALLEHTIDAAHDRFPINARHIIQRGGCARLFLERNGNIERNSPCRK